MIHPTAIIDPRAQVHPTAEVGPHTVIDAGVIVGAGCRIGPFVHLTGRLTLGSGNRIHTGAVLGDAPQDLKYRDQPSQLVIGDDNVIREHVTIHRSNSEQEATVLGSGNFLMASCHVGHNSRLGDRVIVANGTQIAGHVVIEDRAFISGNCLIHQFVRVGALSLMQGGAGISQDLPPFTVARNGPNTLCGLNMVGLRRAGVSPADRLELKRLYHFLFRSHLPLRSSLENARARFHSSVAGQFLDFIAASRRGVCRPWMRDHLPETPDAEEPPP